jgi:hypothetical protein
MEKGRTLSPALSLKGEGEKHQALSTTVRLALRNTRRSMW